MDNDTRMMRQAVLQTWLDQAQAEHRRRNRDRIMVALAAAFCAFTIAVPYLARL